MGRRAGPADSRFGIAHYRDCGSRSLAGRAGHPCVRPLSPVSSLTSAEPRHELPSLHHAAHPPRRLAPLRTPRRVLERGRDTGASARGLTCRTSRNDRRCREAEGSTSAAVGPLCQLGSLDRALSHVPNVRARSSRRLPSRDSVGAVRAGARATRSRLPASRGRLGGREPRRKLQRLDTPREERWLGRAPGAPLSEAGLLGPARGTRWQGALRDARKRHQYVPARCGLGQWRSVRFPHA